MEAQATDNPQTQKIVLAIHGGGIGRETSEVALAVAGYHPATLAQATDGLGVHDLWIFEGLLPRDNGDLQVTSTNYDELTVAGISAQVAIDPEQMEVIQLTFATES